MSNALISRLGGERVLYMFYNRTEKDIDGLLENIRKNLKIIL